MNNTGNGRLNIVSLMKYLLVFLHVTWHIHVLYDHMKLGYFKLELTTAFEIIVQFHSNIFK